MEAMPRDSVVLTDVRNVQELGVKCVVWGNAWTKATRPRGWWTSSNALGRTEPWGEAAYAVWSSPWMAAGCDTFIHDVMRHWGIANAISPDAEGRYPTLGEGPEAGAAAASVWLLPSEPFPFKTRHLRPSNKVIPMRGSGSWTARPSAGMARACSSRRPSPASGPMGGISGAALMLSLRHAVMFRGFF